MAGRDVPSGSAVRDAERSVVGVHIAGRTAQLAFSALMVANDRRRFRRPALQWTLLAAATVESTWLAARLLRRGRYQDRLAMWVDTTFATTGLVVCQAGLGDGGGALWMKNLAIGAAHGTSGPDAAVDRIGALGMLSAAALWCSTRGGGAGDGETLASGVNDVINWVGQHAAARMYVTAHRRHAVLAELAGQVAVARAEEAAAAAERNRQQRELHARTVEVLRELATSTDATAATALARREASRLRRALRTSREPRSSVRAALESACAALDRRALSIELVTAELTADAHQADTAALHAAVVEALTVASDIDDVSRVVVRAANDETTMTVTLRHQGEGFEIDSASDHEQRLRALTTTFVDASRGAELWSAPGRGVRLTLRVPTAPPSVVEDETHESAHVLPRVGARHASAADDDVADRDHHIVRSLGIDLVGARQREIGPGVVDHAQAGAARDPLEPAAQEGAVGYDPRGRTPLHTPRMASSRSAVVGTTTPFSGDVGSGDLDEERRTGRTIISGFVAYRFAGIATGLAAVIAGRRRYRSRPAAAVQLIAAAAESAWIARRLWRGGGRDALAMGVDAVTAIATVTSGRSNVAAVDRGAFVNWAPWGFAAPAVAGQAMAAAYAPVSALASAAAVGTTTSVALSAGPGEFVTNLGAMAGLVAGGHVLAEQIRRGAHRLELARARAVEEGIVLAAERERVRQLRLLHDSALQTLEAVAAGRALDHERMRSRALDEAERLQSELDGGPARSRSISAEIERVASAHEARGFHVDLVAGAVPDLPAAVASALRDACNEALTNAAKHSGVSEASLHIGPVRNGVEITVRDAGIGFDPRTETGFGTTESIIRRLSEVGGVAEIHSEREGGTTVVLWGPA